jgi:hypothetical protein
MYTSAINSVRFFTIYKKLLKYYLLPLGKQRFKNTQLGILYFDTPPNPPLLKLLVCGLAAANTHSCAAIITNMTVRAFHAGMCKGDKTSLCHQNIKHKNMTKLQLFFICIMVSCC